MYGLAKTFARSQQQLIGQIGDRNPVFGSRPGPRDDPFPIEQCHNRAPDFRGPTALDIAAYRIATARSPVIFQAFSLTM